MTITKPGHFVVIPTAMWGHLRPLLHLSLNLLTLHPHLHLTLLLSPSVSARAEKELKTVSFAHIYTPSPTPSPSQTPRPDGAHHLTEQEKRAEDKAIIDRLQLITCVSKEFDLEAEWTPERMGVEAMDYAKAIPSFLKALFGKEHEVEGAQSRFEGIPPSFIIYDVFQPFTPEVVRGVTSSLSVPMIPLVGFIPSNATSGFHHFAKDDNVGTFSYCIARAKEDIAKGVDPVQAHVDHIFEPVGKVKTLPGLPAKYDYEWWPLVETCPAPGEGMMVLVQSLGAVHDKDTVGLICPSPAEAEMEGVKVLEQELGKRVFMVGPQFPESLWLGEAPERQAQNADDQKVFDFLGKMEKKHGKKSVIYVSLGSLFFPILRPELIRYLLTSLRESGFPFVFAYASGIAPPPVELLQEFKDEEDSCMVKFAPQWDVLHHPATGFFLTHCGSNSTFEAILAELPVATMPFAADQGEFASILTEVYKVGIDLKQVKTFKNPEWTKLYDGTTVVGTEEAIKDEMKATWARLRGAEGEEMRERMRGLKSLVEKSWKHGRSRTDMLALGTFYE